jgi:sigma-B regulation protein RsbU (phosphoserine phosphatase)
LPEVESPEIIQLKNELQRLKSAVEELTVLNDLAIAASSTLEVDQMLDIIVQKSIKAVKAEQGKIMLVTEEKGAPLQTLIRQDNFSGRSTSYNVGTHITGWVLKNQKTLMIEDLATDNRFTTSEEEKKEIRSVLCVPIWFRAKIVGVLMVTNKKSTEIFTENDSRLLSIIAAQSGQLIRNSQLQEEALEKKRMEQELTFARNIQMSLVPMEDPKSDLYEIASYFNPADEVGGDYFDYFFLDEKKIAVVQADVSGHGVSAAMIMTMVKGILSSITHRFTSVDEALLEINSTLNKIAPQEMFVTMIFMVYDLEKKILKLSNAGHNPPLIYKNKSKSYDWIEIPGCALNLTDSPVYQLEEIPINSNDLFLLYTDGVTETINSESEMYGKDRLAQLIEKVINSSTTEIIDHIKNDLNSFSNHASQADDIALIAIKIK